LGDKDGDDEKAQDQIDDKQVGIRFDILSVRFITFFDRDMTLFISAPYYGLWL
jgi:hypothetical protein